VPRGHSSNGVGRAATDPLDEHDVVISHVAADAPWADWIGWQLREAGWRVAIRGSASGPNGAGPNGAGPNGAGLAAARAPRTLIVLSSAYLTEVPGGSGGSGGSAVSAGFFVYQRRRAVTVRVEPCEPPGWLADLETVDLVGLGEAEARTTLLDRLTAALPGDEDAGGSARPAE
jgi:hypothetical protein